MSDDNCVKDFKPIDISNESGRILENILESWFQNGDGRYEVVMGKTQNYRTLCLIETCNEFCEKISQLEKENAELKAELDKKGVEHDRPTRSTES